MAKKRIFISDVHLGAGRPADTPSKYKYDWDWLDSKETQNFCNFLNFLGSDYLNEIKEIILGGDIFDTWIYPHDMQPPTIDDILRADKNKAVIAALNALSAKVPVFYIPGNHDMTARREIIKRTFPQMTYVPERFIAGRLIAEHGHRYALFNAPPYFSKHIMGLPLGYFISRVEATRKAMTNDGSRNYRSYLDDMLEILGPATLPQCVFEAVLEEANLSEETVFHINGVPDHVPASIVKETYKDIYSDWPTRVVSRPRAVLAEMNRLEPIADRICKNGEFKVCVFGHSHKWDIDKDTLFCDDRIYVNAGYWCGSNCTFAEIEKRGGGKYIARLRKWQKGKLHKIASESVS
ncbi:MAG: metallophosphoesterase [Myxococcota bacterium]|nr:metallophosphoesterase [Myxococcota bacterium]